MHGAIGVVGFLLPLAFGVVVMVVYGFEMPCPLVFCAQRVIQAHIEGPCVGLGGVGDAVRHSKMAYWSPQVFGCPGTEAQTISPIRGIWRIDDESIDTGDSFVPCIRHNQCIGHADDMLPLRLGEAEV